MAKLSPWYNYWHPEYNGSEPAFVEVEKESWASELEENYNSFRTEIENFIKENPKQYKPYNLKSLNQNSGWSTITFKTWGINVNSNLNKTKTVDEFLKKFPEILSFAVSKMSAKTVIKPHNGDTNTIWRCHFGIKIPSTLPHCGIEVKSETKSWEEGKVLAFCDAFNHRAWNQTDEERIIVIFDILRPEFSHLKNKVCINVRSFMLLQILLEKVSFIGNAPKFIHRFIFGFLKLILIVIYPYQKRKGVLLNHGG
ncbi:MAG: aspartyl/asparaginyl beta-hydroxylase domain-containing protein [Flavobacteriales bacterium]